MRRPSRIRPSQRHPTAHASRRSRIRPAAHASRRSRTRSLAALAVGLLALAGLCSCGGIAADAVVEVDGSAITKATFAHWMKVAKAPSKPGAGYQAAKQEVLGFLITADWIIGEGSALGVKLSDEEVKRELVKEKVAAFPEPAKFKAYLQSAGETVSDVLLSLKVKMLEQKLQERALKGKTETAQQRAFAAFVKRFRNKWTAKTECRAGYVVVDCKEYKAPRERGQAPKERGRAPKEREQAPKAHERAPKAPTEHKAPKRKPPK